MLAVEVTNAGGRPTVRIVGAVDREVITEVSGAIRGLVAVGVREVVVDLSRSTDGAVLLPALARARAALVERNGALHLVGATTPEFLAAMPTAPLEEVFIVDDAVRSSAAPTVPATRHADVRPPGMPARGPGAARSRNVAH